MVLARLHGVEAGVGVGDEGPDDLVDGRDPVRRAGPHPAPFRVAAWEPVPPVVRIPLDADVLARTPLHEAEGTRADQGLPAVVGGVVDDLLGGHAAEHVLR